MRVHGFIHAPGEGLGAIAEWACNRGHTVTETRLYAGDAFPDPADYDLLAVMGGGMNIYQHRDFPWLVPEKRALAAAIRAQKRVLGVRLGAQLIADSLGAKVYQNAEKEIGWFPVTLAHRPGPFAACAERLTVFHWHGDTFELPPGAEAVAASEACPQQAFLFGERIAGVQFHLEITPATIGAFLEGGEGFLVPGRYVQSKEQILSPPAGFDPAGAERFLDALAAR